MNYQIFLNWYTYINAQQISSLLATLKYDSFLTQFVRIFSECNFSNRNATLDLIITSLFHCFTIGKSKEKKKLERKHIDFLLFLRAGCLLLSLFTFYHPLSLLTSISVFPIGHLWWKKSNTKLFPLQSISNSEQINAPTIVGNLNIVR